MLEKSSRKKKKQKLEGSGQEKSTGVVGKDLSGSSAGQGGAVVVTPPKTTSSLALVEGHEAQPLSTLVHATELPPAATVDQEQGKQLRGA